MRRVQRAITGGLVVACFCVLATVQADQWPQFRGPGARGVAASGGLPDTWSATQNVAWKRDLPGRGWSSPVVWGTRIFLTSVVNRGAAEEPRKGLYFGGNRPDPPASEHEWHVICLDLDTGAIVWQRVVHQGVPRTPIHLKNSYASETPVVDAERVYFHFGNVGVYCFTHAGEPVWQQLFEPRAMRFGWGTAASPALHGDRLYVVNDNDDASYLRALNKRTGEQIWQVDRDEHSNWSTPYVWENDQRTELVTAGSDRVRSYDLDGNLLWWLEGMSSITIATPYASEGLLYVSSGYVGDKLKPIYAIRTGATGDITLAENETQNDSIAWCDRSMAPYNPTTLVYDHRLYVLYDFGLLACLDPLTGDKIYDRTRIPRGRAFTASPWACDGKIFCLNEDGVTFVLRAGDQFELLHTNQLAADDMGMATPAVAGTRLLIRTGARVYCIQRPDPG